MIKKFVFVLFATGVSKGGSKSDGKKSWQTRLCYKFRRLFPCFVKDIQPLHLRVKVSHYRFRKEEKDEEFFNSRFTIAHSGSCMRGGPKIILVEWGGVQKILNLTYITDSLSVWILSDF